MTSPVNGSSGGSKTPTSEIEDGFLAVSFDDQQQITFEEAQVNSPPPDSNAQQVSGAAQMAIVLAAQVPPRITSPGTPTNAHSEAHLSDAASEELEQEQSTTGAGDASPAALPAAPIRTTSPVPAFKLPPNSFPLVEDTEPAASLTTASGPNQPPSPKSSNNLLPPLPHSDSAASLAPPVRTESSSSTAGSTTGLLGAEHTHRVLEIQSHRTPPASPKKKFSFLKCCFEWTCCLWPKPKKT
ncbi:MAG: hypothetical protein JSS32_08820 [Verrucomicrobia bacterium]|nr:hypothetical protein [Verrucomicrobiota bacterium]